ncbi:MAG TPA: metallophosphoesterase [Conexibacter sp.]|nr:metallophosphoesterase [Conexibacter sp.]
MGVIRVLHVSDLHARANWTRNQRKLAEAMLTDARGMHDERAIDLAVVSGDLSFSGTGTELQLAKEFLLDRLTREFGLSLDRLVAIPGNHDVDRTLIDATYELGLLHQLIDRDAVDGLLADDARRAVACARLAGWDAFHGAFYAAHPPSAVAPLAYVHRTEVRGTSVGVVALNSAWRSSGDKDRGRLLVGESQLEPALATTDDCDLRLVAVHHPLEWLVDFDRRDVALLLERHGAIVLSGHEHTADPVSVVSARGSAVFERVGCLYESREHFNSYSMLDVDLDAGTVVVHVRTWWPERGEFDRGVDRAPDGTVMFDVPGARPRAPGPPEPTEPSPLGDSIPEETRFVLLLAACADLASDAYLVTFTTGRTLRALHLVQRHLPVLTHDALRLADALNAASPGLPAQAHWFVEKPMSAYVDVMQSWLMWFRSRAHDEPAPEALTSARKHRHQAYYEAWEELRLHLERTPAFAAPLAQRFSEWSWKMLGFASRTAYEEYLEPSMSSLTESPGELAEDVLERLLDGPLVPDALRAEGLPPSITVDLLNRLLTSHWARFEDDGIALTDAGRRLLARRLARWRGSA